MAPRFKCCRKEYWKEKANLTWTSNVTKRKKLFDVDYIDDNGETVYHKSFATFYYNNTMLHHHMRKGKLVAYEQ